MIPGFLIPLVANKYARWVGMAFMFLLAVVTFGAVKKRQGKQEAKEEFKDADYEMADDIRDDLRQRDRVQPDGVRYRD